MARTPAPAWAEAAPPIAPGIRLCRGRFEVGALIGRGAMGAVYQVRDGIRCMDLALKMLLDTRPERLLAFKHEFRALQGLTHRNLVRLDELFESDGRWFFTMELIRGVPFLDFVRPATLSVHRLRRALGDLARGLVALHDLGKVHHDVKPSNTLVDAEGRLVLLDFGLVRDVAAGDEPPASGGGTAAYMAPEQVAGDGGAAADWYSVGVMLYQALAGVFPFPTASPAGERPVPRLPSTLVADVPADLEQLCLDLLVDAPERRPDGREILLRLDTRQEDRPWPPQVRRAPRSIGGRRDQLALLRGALARVGERQVTVVITGAAGTGKSALLETFLGSLGPPVQVLVGRCYEHEFLSFKALDGLVDALVQHLERFDDAALTVVLPADTSALVRVFPMFLRIANRSGLAGDGNAPGRFAGDRPRALATLRELLVRLAGRGPLVLAFDELQWADADGLAALLELLSGPDLRNVLAILTVRSGAGSTRRHRRRRFLRRRPLGRETS